MRGGGLKLLKKLSYDISTFSKLKSEGGFERKINKTRLRNNANVHQKMSYQKNLFALILTWPLHVGLITNTTLKKIFSYQKIILLPTYH